MRIYIDGVGFSEDGVRQMVTGLRSRVATFETQVTDLEAEIVSSGEAFDEVFRNHLAFQRQVRVLEEQVRDLEERLAKAGPLTQAEKDDVECRDPEHCGKGGYQCGCRGAS